MSTFSTGQVSVNSTATAIFTEPYTAPYVVKNSGNETAFIGTSGVTTDTGFVLLPGESFTITLGNSPTVTLYGVTSGGTTTISYFEAE